MITIFAEKKTARLDYILQFIFKQVIGSAYQLIHDVEAFNTNKNFKLNYSSLPLDADLTIEPHPLLFETKVEAVSIEIVHWRQLPIFFSQSDAIIPFDIFAAAFYLITRYEEYLPFEADQYHRFPHQFSLAFRHHFLKIPLVDLWIMELEKEIKAKSSQIVFLPKPYQFIPTYDIDIAYSYLGKGFVRNFGGFWKDILHRKPKKALERLQVLLGLKKDPFDSFAFLDEMHRKYELSPIYFLLLGKVSALDRNIEPSHPYMQALINTLQVRYAIGIHPSYNSHKGMEILESEMNQIKTNKSRQHYIRFQLPLTFRNLIKLGITEDYSMGYGSINGFRASTSYPFFWFDVEKNECSPLLLYPFCFMECNSKFEQHDTAKQALDEMKDFERTIKQVRGTFVTIWHNFSLGSEHVWLPWKEVYAQFLSQLR